MDNYNCPVCSNLLVPIGQELRLNDLLALWQGVTFSSETIDEHMAQSSFTRLYACAHCKLEIFLPKIVGTPKFYIDLQKDAGSYYESNKWDFETALFDAKNATAIIELGCGPGVFLNKARSIVKLAIGLEYNSKAIEAARNKGLSVFNIEDNLEHMKGEFDIAFSFHVLEHVSDPVVFVKDMLSWVKPGGKIGISVPNMDGPIKYINPCASNMPPHHSTRWKLETFRLLAESLGLVVERVDYEPLMVRDHYYYSFYWANSFLSRGSFPKILAPMFMKFVPFALRQFFSILAKFGISEFFLLRGQSIYVLFSKKKGEN